MTKLEWGLFIIMLFGPKVTFLDKQGKTRFQYMGVITLFISKVTDMTTNLLGEANGKD
ncbi:hypothetical protein Q3F77_11750 [Enterococcus faecium]|nr:hypothetical protein [Enterococcus faecium]